MTPKRWREIDAYVAGLLAPPDPGLDSVLAAAAAAGLPPDDVSPAQGKLLHVLARAVAARSILEVGTLGGYSTVWLARALEPGGRLVTVEIDGRRAAVARANVARAGLDGRVDVRVGRASDVLPRLATEGAGPFDLVFLDGDKADLPHDFAASLSLARPGTLVLADNVVRGGAVGDPEHGDARVQGVRRFLELLAGDPRVSATVVQTVGSKGYDGFALAVVER